MKFYIILFSHCVSGKIVAESEEQCLQRINSYLEYQNRGEARSDKLRLISYKEVAYEEYCDRFVTGSLNDNVLGNPWES